MDVGNQRARVQHDHPVSQLDGFVHVMCHQQNGGLVPLAEPDQKIMHTDAGQGVQGAERLVRQQQFRRAHEGAGQCHTLLFAAGQFMRPGAFTPLQTDFFQCGQAASFDIGSGQSQHDIIQRALPGQQSCILE